MVYPYRFIKLSEHAQNLRKTLPLDKRLIAMKPETPPLLDYLKRKGISLEDLIDTALEMFVPHPGVETEEKAKKLFREEFLETLSDVNVSCLEIACFRAQEDAEKGLIPGLSTERFMGRPGLIADELLGLAIANYIAGVRGIFEFTRFDQAKPGILKKLGPITNDAIGGLIAGVSSNVYTRAFRNSE